jgi:hypothetical protein
MQVKGKNKGKRNINNWVEKKRIFNREMPRANYNARINHILADKQKVGWLQSSKIDLSAFLKQRGGS